MIATDEWLLVDGELSDAYRRMVEDEWLIANLASWIMNNDTFWWFMMNESWSPIDQSFNVQWVIHGKWLCIKESR